MDLELDYKSKIVAVDSTAILTKKNGAVDLLFLQFVSEGPAPKANVVAGVRLTSIKELEDLKSTIEESIRKHQSAED